MDDIDDIVATREIGEVVQVGAWGMFLECPKCNYGSGDHSMNYCGPDQRFSVETYNPGENKWDKDFCGTEGEHFHRECVHCSYRWQLPVT